MLSTPAFAGVGQYTGGESANGIGNSRHNLGNYGEHIQATGGGNTAGTSEICVFCHTPHHTNTAGTSAPLWNKSTAAAATYVAYGTTIGGNTPVALLGSSSAACLGCHDGVTTYDNLANAPGKGGVGKGYTTTDMGWIFTDPAKVTTANPTGTVTDYLTSERLVIGTNLSNDHPVSIAYQTNVASLRPTNTVIATVDLDADLTATTNAELTANLAQNRWAIKGFVISNSSTETIASLLRNGGKVECSSCHDPHFNNKSADEIDATYGSEFENGALFLRRVGGNSGSGVCRTCHNK